MGSIIQGLLEKIFGWIWDWIIGPFGDLSSWRELIYGSSDAEVWATFSVDDITNVYVPGINTMFVFVGTVLLIGIIMGGIRISSTGINPSNRTYVIEFFKDLLIVGILLFNLETVYSVLFSINYFIVNKFSTTGTENLGSLSQIFDSVKDHGILGALIIGLVMLGLTIWANFYYMMRKMTLLLFMILGPLMISFYLIPQTKNITTAWVKELIGTVFVQSIHAMLFWMITILSDNSSMISAVIIHVVFIPLSESLRSMLGLGGNTNDRISRAGAMMGLSGLVTMGGAIKGALQGKSVREAIMGGIHGFKNTRNNNHSISKNKEDDSSNLTTLNNAGTDIGSTPTADRMLTSGEIMSKGGKAIAGAAGAIAGMPLGPMGSIALASVGSTSGGVLGGLTGRVGMTAINAGGKIGRKIGQGFQKGKEKFGEMYNAENTNDEFMAQELADSWTTDWANKNRKDFDERWKDLSNQEKENLWQSTLAKQKEQNLNKARQWIKDIKDGKSAYADANSLINSTVDKLTNTWADENKKDFFANYDKENPLSENATQEERDHHATLREEAWNKELGAKKEAIKQAAIKSAGINTKIGNDENQPIHVGNFARNIGHELQNLGIYADANKTQEIIKQLHPAEKSNYANASQLIDSTVDKLTDDWAKKNKKAFMEEYDRTNHFNGNDHVQYQINKEKAWQTKIAQKREEIANVVTDTANQMSHQANLAHAYVNKEDFTKQVGANVSNIIGKDYDEATKLVADATSTVKNASLYSGRTLNKSFMANRIATIHTEQARENFITKGMESGRFETPLAAANFFDKNEAHHIFAKNLEQANQIIPNSLEVPYNVSNNKLIKGVSASVGFTETFLSNSLGLPELREKVTNSRLGAFITGLKTAETNKIGAGLQSAFKYYTPINPVQKQFEFKNKLSYIAGAIGGVGAYKAAAKFASGGKNWENTDGSFAFKWNPYNKHVQKQTAEISEIEQMAQKIAIHDEHGNVIRHEIPDGTIRMATSNNETVIQVRNKAGEIQTVSRLGSGDSSLRKGNTIYQNLTISKGKLIPSSGVYREDSSGGKILLNRNINIDPNKLVSNKANKVQQIIKDPPPFSQFVESNQYYFDNLLKDGIENIKMIVGRNRSYLVGTKDNMEYRISNFGPGDTRLATDQVIYQECRPINRTLKVTNTFTKFAGQETWTEYNEYSTTQDPTNLLPKKINKRNRQRQEFEKAREIAFIEPLR